MADKLKHEGSDSTNIIEENDEKDPYTDSQSSNNSDLGHSSDTKSSSSSPPSDTCTSKRLPPVANKWERGDLQHLKITIDESTYHSLNPKQLVELLIGFMPNENNDFLLWTEHISNLRKHVTHWKEAIEKTKAYGQFGMDIPFEDLTTDKAIVDLLATKQDMWEMPSDVQNNGKEFKTLFEEAGKSFTEILFRCIYLKNKNGRLMEDMYQHLFVSFLQLFNVKCHFVPCVTEQSMTICGRTVKGIPDVTVEVFKFHSKTHQSVIDWKFLTVCEVKKEHRREDIPPPKKTRCSIMKDRFISSFVPDNFLGQHGAELLLHYPSSVSENHIIGMIVEQTFITFLALSMTKDQYKQIMDGTLKGDRENGPKLYVTRSYDFLVWKDRICLTEALLTLGYLQKHGSEYFFS